MARGSRSTNASASPIVGPRGSTAASRLLHNAQQADASPLNADWTEAESAYQQLRLNEPALRQLQADLVANGAAVQASRLFAMRVAGPPEPDPQPDRIVEEIVAGLHPDDLQLYAEAIANDDVEELKRTSAQAVRTFVLHGPTAKHGRLAAAWRAQQEKQPEPLSEEQEQALIEATLSSAQVTEDWIDNMAMRHLGHRFETVSYPEKTTSLGRLAHDVSNQVADALEDEGRGDGAEHVRGAAGLRDATGLLYALRRQSDDGRSRRRLQELLREEIYAEGFTFDTELRNL